MTYRRPPPLPEPIDRATRPFSLEPSGWWLVLCDVHLPFHDRATVELAVKAAKKNNVTGVLLNGDILDCHELSTFDKTPDDPRYPEEVQTGREFLAYLRGRLPKAKIIYKDGNHEERLYRYLCRKAPALFGLDVLTIPNLLQFEKHGVTHVTDRRVVLAGKLHVIHGHEYPRMTVPVNAARGLFLRSKGLSLCGHWHATSEHHEPTIGGKPLGAWSVGCACGLSPPYQSLSRWNHGFALVRIDSSGEFEVRNLRVLDGKVL